MAIHAGAPRRSTLAPADHAKLDDLRARLADLKSEPGATLEALYAAQDVFSYVPPEAVTMIAEELRLPESEVFGVLTFYTMFHRKPAAKYVLRGLPGPELPSLGRAGGATHPQRGAGQTGWRGDRRRPVRNRVGLVPGAVRSAARRAGEPGAARTARPGESPRPAGRPGARGRPDGTRRHQKFRQPAVVDAGELPGGGRLPGPGEGPARDDARGCLGPYQGSGLERSRRGVLPHGPEMACSCAETPRRRGTW